MKVNNWAITEAQLFRDDILVRLKTFPRAFFVFLCQFDSIFRKDLEKGLPFKEVRVFFGISDSSAEPRILES